jgi:hypothetical protein
MEVLDAMQVGQGKGKAFSLLGRNEFIDIDRLNRLIARLIATTVAKRFPASGKTGQKDISHNGPLSCGTDAGGGRRLRLLLDGSPPPQSGRGTAATTFRRR